jgi:hypothetical protein
MQAICDDIIIRIGYDLTNVEKLMLTMTCKSMDGFRYRFAYTEKVHINKIKSLLYFDNFEYVDISNKLTDNLGHDIEIKCPKNVKKVYYYVNIFARDFWGSLCYIPSIVAVTPIGITHLEFHDDFNQPIDRIIPSSVTHLKLGNKFNQSLKHNIPFVTHLTVGKNFCQPRENIPSSVICLKFLDIPELVKM